MEDLTGQVLGERFRIDRFLGRGGMADVYQVWDQQRSVALAAKVLHGSMTADPVFLQRFEREAEVLEKLQHPHIVRCYGLVKTGSLAFILMDFIDGLTLRREISLSRGGMRPARVLQIAEPVCAALHYAHQLRMVHCDIKPSNIMIHRNGTVYLTDFGIARATEATTPSATGGTPAYMAPEQFTGANPSPATDIYALGIVLYEMLSGGRRPYTGDNAQIAGTTGQRIAWEKANLPVPPLRTYRPDISPALELVVMRCLEGDPAGRFPTVLDLQHALVHAVRNTQEAEPGTLAGIMDTDTPAPAEEPLAEDAKRVMVGRIISALEEDVYGDADLEASPDAQGQQKKAYPVWMWLAAALVVFGVITVGLLASGRRPGSTLAGVSTATGAATTAVLMPTAEESLVQPSATAAELEQTSTATASPPTETPLPLPTATLLGGSGRIAFASDRNGSVQVWVMDADGKDLQQVTKAEKGACQPEWSPDGKKIAYITPCNGPRLTYPGADIEIIELETGTVTDLDLVAGGFDPSWSPDGAKIVYTKLVNDRTTIYTHDLLTGASRLLADRDGKNTQPAWSPDGKYIVFTSVERGIDEIWRMRADGSSQEELTQAGPLKYFSQPAWSPDGLTILATLKELNQPGPVLVQIDPANPSGGEIPIYQGPAQNETVRMEDGAFSPDGRWVVYWTMPEGNNMEIIRAGLDGQVTNLTKNKKRDFHPAWSRQ